MGQFFGWTLGRKPQVGTVEAMTDGDGVSRRDFLRAGSLTVVGLSSAARAAAMAGTSNRRAILIVMTGGPSQLETFDPKPDAISSIRGPFKSIETATPGIRFGESLPRLAKMSDRLAIIRTLNHDAAPIHETGLQLLQTGQLSNRDVLFPHWGSLVSQTFPGRSGLTNVVLPRLVDRTGVSAYRGQLAGFLGTEWQPVVHESSADGEPESARRLYGDSEFGQLLLSARQQIERGARCVTVNLFDSLEQKITWDCHGNPACGPATLFDYQDRLCPQFDQALSGLLEDLAQRGLLDETLVIATGEMGRSPDVNENAGREHWTNCWSALVAGGRITGGRAIGTSDSHAAEPIDHPVALGEIAATLLEWSCANWSERFVEIKNQQVPLVPHQPLAELWS